MGSEWAGFAVLVFGLLVAAALLPIGVLFLLRVLRRRMVVEHAAARAGRSALERANSRRMFACGTVSVLLALGVLLIGAQGIPWEAETAAWLAPMLLGFAGLFHFLGLVLLRDSRRHRWEQDIEAFQ